MAAQPPICDFGWKAPDFTLPGVDGKSHSLSDLKGPKGTVVVFICNHCPYVKSIVDRLVREAAELKAIGVNGSSAKDETPARMKPSSSASVVSLSVFQLMAGMVCFFRAAGKYGRLSLDMA